MGITLGKKMPKVVGANVYDRTRNKHLGIIEFPVSILKGNAEIIKTIREIEPEIYFLISGSFLPEILTNKADPKFPQCLH